MGVGEDGMPLMVTAGATRERGVENRPGGAAAGRGDTCKYTSAAADKAGEGGRHGSKRERAASRRENPAGKSYGVGGGGEGGAAYGVATELFGVRGDGGVCKAYGVTENPGGYRQGVGWGVQLPQGIDSSGVDALSWGDENPGVDTAGKGVTGEGG